MLAPSYPAKRKLGANCLFNETIVQMKPFIHARLSVKRHGGKLEDYMAIHDFIDSSKIAVPDVRHRAMLHSSWGCYLVEKIFGVVSLNSDNRQYSPRDIAEEHIQDDLGFIPTLEKWLNIMPIEQWMSGSVKSSPKRVVNFNID